MRKYDENSKELTEVSCNYCGRQLHVSGGIVKEGIVSVDNVFGYFSDKDGQVHSFDLCEKCYDNLMLQFELPATIRNAKELL